MVVAGSTTRSYVAGTPSTVTESTVRPSKSSENDRSGAPVVLARIVVLAESRTPVMEVPTTPVAFQSRTTS
ncbi:hypothetical protein [Nocardioides renjunii]|uniref:hypothetical protein n=1 Tax=Nocardioides renjunii TaxID=3095075 RepID=UPI002AFF5EB5|nr:hypothetical protein [Nocardioides sp. S-34]WQQ24340.1 hypothetical protein SHK17_10195 [Nocardioides sp. S-34]